MNKIVISFVISFYGTKSKTCEQLLFEYYIHCFEKEPGRCVFNLYNIALKWSLNNMFMKKFYSTFSFEVIDTEKDYTFKYFQIFRMLPQNQITASQRCGDINNLYFSKTCCFNKVQNQKWSFKFDALVVSSFCFECTFDI